MFYSRCSEAVVSLVVSSILGGVFYSRCSEAVVSLVVCSILGVVRL